MGRTVDAMMQSSTRASLKFADLDHCRRRRRLRIARLAARRRSDRPRLRGRRGETRRAVEVSRQRRRVARLAGRTRAPPADAGSAARLSDDPGHRSHRCPGRAPRAGAALERLVGHRRTRARPHVAVGTRSVPGDRLAHHPGRRRHGSRGPRAAQDLRAAVLHARALHREHDLREFPRPARRPVPQLRRARVGFRVACRRRDRRGSEPRRLAVSSVRRHAPVRARHWRRDDADLQFRQERQHRRRVSRAAAERAGRAWRQPVAAERGRRRHPVRPRHRRSARRRSGVAGAVGRGSAGAPSLGARHAGQSRGAVARHARGGDALADLRQPVGAGGAAHQPRSDTGRVQRLDVPVDRLAAPGLRRRGGRHLVRRHAAADASVHGGLSSTCWTPTAWASSAAITTRC